LGKEEKKERESSWREKNPSPALKGGGKEGGSAERNLLNFLDRGKGEGE